VERKYVVYYTQFTNKTTINLKLQVLNLLLVTTKAPLTEIYLIKQETSEKSIMPDDPAKDLNFQEPIIDSLRAQKDDVSKIYSSQIFHLSRYFKLLHHPPNSHVSKTKMSKIYITDMQ
jgi:hypothetical protein